MSVIDNHGYYGEFGGAFVPELLYKNLEELENCYLQIMRSEEFKLEYNSLLRDYVGRPTPLYLARNLSKKYGGKI